MWISDEPWKSPRIDVASLRERPSILRLYHSSQFKVSLINIIHRPDYEFQEEEENNDEANCLMSLLLLEIEVVAVQAVGNCSLKRAHYIKRSFWRSAVSKHVGGAFPAVHMLIHGAAAIVHNCTAECRHPIIKEQARRLLYTMINLILHFKI